MIKTIGKKHISMRDPAIFPHCDICGSKHVTTVYIARRDGRSYAVGLCPSHRHDGGAFIDSLRTSSNVEFAVTLMPPGGMRADQVLETCVSLGRRISKKSALLPWAPEASSYLVPSWRASPPGGLRKELDLAARVLPGDADLGRRIRKALKGDPSGQELRELYRQWKAVKHQYRKALVQAVLKETKNRGKEGAS